MPVYKAKNGTWYVMVRFTDWTGAKKQNCQRGFETKREAQEWEAQFKLQKRADIDMTLESFYKLYAEDLKSRIKENTWLTKESIFQSKILPYLGKRKLSEITTKDIVDWQNTVMKLPGTNGKSLSPTYMKTIHSELSALFNHAIRFYDLGVNPASRAGTIGMEESKEMKFWTKEEYMKFADVMMDRPILYYAFEVLYWTGIREGELFALTPEDFDFEKKTLRINKSYQRLKGKDVITCPKTPNSVRAKDTMPLPDQERKVDNVAGFKHRASDQFMRNFKNSVMDICQREGLYQVDLLNPARVRITDREYWAQRRGQSKLDQENAAKAAAGEKPEKTVYETENAILRRQIKSVLEDSQNFDDFRQKLLGTYGILVSESRGRINYLPSDRTKPIRGRMLGADFEKESLEEYFRQKNQKLHYVDKVNRAKVTEIVRSSVPEVTHMSLIMQLQVIVEEQQKPYYSQDAKIRNLKDMASTLAFSQENNIGSQEELESLLASTHEDYVAKKEIHAATTAELAEARDILRYTKQRHANKKIYLEFMNSKKRAKFRSEHEPEIMLYEAATRELKKLLDGKPVPSEKKTFARIQELSQKKNEEYEELSEIRRREKSLQEKVINVRSIYDEPSRAHAKKKEKELG